MISVVIKDDGEPNVVRLTYENVWRELKDIDASELMISDDWFSALPNVSNKYVCFLEADCLISPGYFLNQMKLFKKNADFRRIAMLASSTAVTYWEDRFFGYSIKNSHIQPVPEKKSRSVYPVQIAYFPGAIVNTAMMMEAVNELPYRELDLIDLSAQISLALWRQNDLKVSSGQGRRVHINPNTVYLTTEQYVDDLRYFDKDIDDVKQLFDRESI
jgi:hypothetical protein